MNLSKRISSLSVSPTVALNVKAKKLKATGADVVNFAVGEPDYNTPVEICEEAISSIKAGKTRYGPAGGSEELRMAICNKLEKENDLTFSPQEIVCGMGAKEILFHIFLSILNEGDEVILTAPCWVSYQDQIKAAGGIPVLIPFSSVDKPCVDEKTIETYATDRTVAFILCSPNNPAGYALKNPELKSLGKYLASKDWWVISDEIYEYLSYDHAHTSILKLCPDLKDQFILVNGLSKSFAMTGWRVGYTAAPSQVAKLVKSLQSHSSTCLPPFIESAAILAISRGSSLMAKELVTLKKRRDLAVSYIKEIPNINFIYPHGAFYLYIDLRKFLEESKDFDANDSMAFSSYLLEEKHLAVVPGEAFGTPGFLRLSYATNSETIKKGIDRLKEALTI